jgi:GNAT superfamily N-acetyltransferase
MLDTLVKALQNNLGNVITNELVYGILAAIQNEERSNAINIQDIPAIEYADNLIQVERIEDVLHELKPVHAAHWQETERYRHGIALNPDYNYMINAERSGRFMLFTVRNQSGVVGNCMMYLSRSTHTQRWVAEEDTIFILPEYRKGRLGVRLIRYVEDVLRNMGVTEIRVTVKTVNDVGRLLSHLGYNHTGNQLTKTLE